MIRSKDIGISPCIVIKEIDKRSKKILFFRQKRIKILENSDDFGEEEIKIDDNIVKNLAEYGEQYFEFFLSLILKFSNLQKK